MDYLHWNEQILDTTSPDVVTDAYDHGYVFTRIGKGVMHQTRSVRINLSHFELSSENRRILKKIQGMNITAAALPYSDYTFTIGKLAKDFYENKFGAGIMSAQKIKEMLTDSTKSNFNTMLVFTNPQHTVTDGSAKLDRSEHEEFLSKKISAPEQTATCGFAICYMNNALLHYSYPFYDLSAPKDTGLGMMILAIQYAKEQGLDYIYLGSLQRPRDTYKLQFSGLEWFNGASWSTDLDAAKELLRKSAVQ